MRSSMRCSPRRGCERRLWRRPKPDCAVFAEGNADEATVRSAVAEAERARVEVRLTHLLTHLRTRDLLTDDQRQVYHRLRWGAAAQ